MATLNDLINRVQDIRNDLERSLGDVATSVSLTAKALAERTIKDKGFGASYSRSDVPAYWFYGQELNASGAALIKERDNKDEGMTWADLRDAQGLQTAFVDLSYSNEMWAGMQPQESFRNGDIFMAPLAHINKEGQKKMNYNYERYGDFVGKALRGDNYDILVDVAIQETVRIFQRNQLF